jgi:hypothetical protein
LAPELTAICSGLKRRSLSRANLAQIASRRAWLPFVAV